MSDTQPPSQMLRVPSALVDAVKELSRLHRSGYTSAVLTGLQQLIASLDSTADSVASVAAGKSDTELLAELISGLDERIATQVAAHVAQLEQRIEQLEQRPSPFSSPPVAQGELLNTTPESQVLQSEPLENTVIAVNSLEDTALGGPGDVGIAIARNTLEDIPEPATPPKPVEAPTPSQGQLTPMTSAGLAERLDVHPSSVTRAKSKTSELFRKWSSELDPDDVAWEYRPNETLKYHPLV